MYKFGLAARLPNGFDFSFDAQPQIQILYGCDSTVRSVSNRLETDINQTTAAACNKIIMP